MCELLVLVEEFSVIIGFPLYCPLVLPYTLRDIFYMYDRDFGPCREDVSTIIFRDGVDFMMLILYLQKNNCTIDGYIGVGLYPLSFQGFPVCGKSCK